MEDTYTYILTRYSLSLRNNRNNYGKQLELAVEWFRINENKIVAVPFGREKSPRTATGTSEYAMNGILLKRSVTACLEHSIQNQAKSLFYRNAPGIRQLSRFNRSITNHRKTLPKPITRARVTGKITLHLNSKGNRARHSFITLLTTVVYVRSNAKTPLLITY